MVPVMKVARLEAVQLESDRARADAAERYEGTIRLERRERFEERAEVSSPRLRYTRGSQRRYGRGPSSTVRTVTVRSSSAFDARLKLT